MADDIVTQRTFEVESFQILNVDFIPFLLFLGSDPKIKVKYVTTVARVSKHCCRLRQWVGKGFTHVCVSVCLFPDNNF